MVIELEYTVSPPIFVRDDYETNYAGQHYSTKGETKKRTMSRNPLLSFIRRTFLELLKTFNDDTIVSNI